jgi:hypothetical protein
MNTNSPLFYEIPPDCDINSSWLSIVNTKLRSCGFTRAGVADRMNKALRVFKVEVDEDQLNSWFSPSSNQHMPVEYLSALMWAITCNEIADALLAPLYFKTADIQAEMRAQHAQIEAEKQKLIKLQNQIEKSLLRNEANI